MNTTSTSPWPIVGAAMGIVAVIVFPFLPVIITAVPSRQTCMSNEKRIGLALMQYVQDYDEMLPPRQIGNGVTALSWRVNLQPYAKSGIRGDRGMFRCPNNRAGILPDIEHDGFDRSYAVNSVAGYGHIQGPFSDHLAPCSLAKVDAPANCIAIVESTAAYNDFNPLFPAPFMQPTRPGQNTGHFFTHGTVTDFIYVDGHASTMRPQNTVIAGTHPNPWTIDGSPFSKSELQTVTSVLQTGQALSATDTQPAPSHIEQHRLIDNILGSRS